MSMIAIVKTNGRDAESGCCGFIVNGDRFKRFLQEMCQKDTMRKVVMIFEGVGVILRNKINLECIQRERT
jgi:hypothetical protein